MRRKLRPKVGKEEGTTAFEVYRTSGFPPIEDTHAKTRCLPPSHPLEPASNLATPSIPLQPVRPTPSVSIHLIFAIYRTLYVPRPSRIRLRSLTEGCNKEAASRRSSFILGSKLNGFDVIGNSRARGNVIGPRAGSCRRSLF